MDHLCYICLVFVMLWGLFIAVLWSPAGLALIFDVKLCICHFPMWYGQVWCLIVSILDLCPFITFKVLYLIKRL